MGVVLQIYAIIVTLSLIIVLSFYLLQRREITRLSQKLQTLLHSFTHAELTLDFPSSDIANLVNALNELFRVYRKQVYSLQKKDEAIKETITNLAHDLRTPVTAIQGYTQMLLQSPELSEEDLDAAAIINERLIVLNQLLNQLFEFGRIEADEMEFSYTIFDLNAVLRSVAVSFFKSFEERKIIPALSIAEISFPFYGDEKAVTRIFENIISNALSHGKSDYHFSSYDNNEFIRGLSSEKWTSLNEDEKKPLYNRFRQVWCPGSTFKPVVAGIGLKTGSIDPKEDFGNAGLAWQKDSSWGSYQVTTLHEYEPVIMKNAIIYSDNIYFAKAALKIGSENFMNTLNEIGFNQNMPFEIAMQESTYSNTDKIETEIQLADSGYGQGQILVNSLHLASIYTSFLNEGNMIKPYLKYKEEASGETWIENAFSKENVEEIMQGVEGVVNDPEGTGYAAHRDDILLAGKTGTAELKATKEDTSGKEIGWFSVFTADKSVDKPILLISMVENVKGIGGSGYVVKKDATVLEEYFEK